MRLVLLRDMISFFATRCCWRCGLRTSDPDMVDDLGSHLAMHHSDPPGWYPGWVNPAIRR